MLRLRRSGAQPFLPLYVVMEWTRTAIPCVDAELSVREYHMLRCSESFLHLRNKKEQRSYTLRSSTVVLVEEMRITEFGWKS